MPHEPGSKSLRLQDYDYAQQGYYHTIIATQQGRQCFGSVVAEEMSLNTLGQIAQESLLSLSRRFSNVELDHYVIMPNHIHMLILIKESSICPNTCIDKMPARFQSYWRELEREKAPSGVVPLYEAIRAFKAVTSYHAHRKGQDPSFAWHSGYYERIIVENERFLYNVRRYITNNPKKWEQQRWEWEAAGFRWVKVPHQVAR